jgi:hypothetical protein
MFSFNDNRWLARARMPVATAGHAVAALDDDTALLCGGWNQVTQSVYATCFVYIARANEWSSCKWSMNAGRSEHGMAVYKSRVYVYGGYDGNQLLASVEVLSDSDGWQRLEYGLFRAGYSFASVALPAANYDRCHHYCACKKNSHSLCIDGVDCSCSIIANITGNQQTADEIRQQRVEEHKSSNPYHGILINSDIGTQLFDFDYFPYSTGNYSLELQTNANAASKGPRAVLIGNSAYFAGTDASLVIYGMHQLKLNDQ